MRELWLYRWMSGFSFMNYRAKIMIMAFIGTHIPLISLASYFAFQSAPDWGTFFTTVGITLIATLAGTGLTLFVLNELLRPVILTSKSLRLYRETRERSTLPTNFDDEVGTLMADASLTIDHLETVREALEYLDEPTGLANRKRLLQQIDDRVGNRQAFSVAVMRFMNYARIADALDLSQADRAAKVMAERVSAETGSGAILARVGSSEFALLFDDAGADWSPRLAELNALTKKCSGDIVLASITIKPELYCGLAFFPADADSAAALLDHAIAAASQAGPAMPVVMHSVEARTAAVDRLKIEEELRRALKQDEFRLHYQPVVDVGAGKVKGAEALIRWQHPTRGVVAPANFIPAAEATGLIEPMGLWVMRSACAQVREWNAMGRDGLKVAINLSARQFLDPDLKDHVARALSDTGIDPSQLEIELTETAAMADHDHTRKVFSMLRDLGVSLAIDDFGTGYASMSYLRKLPFDKLKIDREFVSDVYKNREAQAICAALITLSKGMGLDVLAEGAETEEEVDYLNGLGCDLFQGYYFAKPMPADEFGPAVDSLALNAMLKKAGPRPNKASARLKTA